MSVSEPVRNIAFTISKANSSMFFIFSKTTLIGFHPSHWVLSPLSCPGAAHPPTPLFSSAKRPQNLSPGWFRHAESKSAVQSLWFFFCFFYWGALVHTNILLYFHTLSICFDLCIFMKHRKRENIKTYRKLVVYTKAPPKQIQISGPSLNFRNSEFQKTSNLTRALL